MSFTVAAYDGTICPENVVELHIDDIFIVMYIICTGRIRKREFLRVMFRNATFLSVAFRSIKLK